MSCLSRTQQAAIARDNQVKLDQVCLYCSTASVWVEAGGIWFCPNDRCHGPAGGAARHARECKDCKTEPSENGITLIEPCEAFKRKHAEIDGKSGLA
jgi:hypothetical protein